MREVGAIAAPMEWIETIQTSQRFRRHRSFHRMKDARICDPAEQWVGSSVGLQLSGWIAEVPRNQVNLSVDVAGTTSHCAVTRELGVIKKTTPLSDRVRRRVITANRNFFEDRVRGR